MRTVLYLIFVGLLAGAVPGQAGAEEPGFAEIRALGQLNGVALQCGYHGEVRRMKQAIIAYVPKTRTHGAAFEEATNAGFLGHIQAGEPCPTAATLEAAVDGAIDALRQAYSEPRP